MSEPGLTPQHREYLRDRAVADEVASERGYLSAICKADLQKLGFGRAQQLVPALVIPIWSVGGEVESYQLRPDTPRLNEKGKPSKYELKGGTRMLLDVHPRLTRRRQNGRVPLIADPGVPLFITEGIPKADAAVSIGLSCIALLGVFNFRGTNESGGRTALADWESVALNDRNVYIAFDSDVMEKREVYSALARLKALLESRGATIRLIYLLPGPHGQKVGLDDWIAASKSESISDQEIRIRLLGLATDELRKAPDQPKRTSDKRAVEAAIRAAEAVAVAPSRAQYLDAYERWSTRFLSLTSWRLPRAMEPLS